MKITEQDKLEFRKLQEKHNIKEGLLNLIFRRALKKGIKGNAKLQQTIKNADKELSQARKWIKDQEKQGNKIHPALKKYIN
tara:strand:+ start:224 stop:466 length:243 start_codon:yes stop_codon:yes gene_type:complete